MDILEITNDLKLNYFGFSATVLIETACIRLLATILQFFHKMVDCIVR